MTWRYAASRERDGPLWARLASVWRHRMLLRRMSERELRLRYAGSAIGRGWAIAFPLLLVLFYAAVFTFVFRGRLPGEEGEGTPQRYALYVLTGLLPWAAFTEVATRAAQTMSEHRSLVKHVMFPVQILPLTGIYGVAIPQLVGLVLLGAYAAWINGGPVWNLPLLLLTLVLQIGLLGGVAWLLGAVGALVRDVREALALLLTAGMFATPIFYAERDAPALLRIVLTLNPLTHLINCYRDAFHGGPLRHPESIPVLAVVSVMTLIFGFWVFDRSRVVLADVL